MDILLQLLPIFTQYGHIAVFLMLLVCGLGVPFPEDITLVTGGVIAGLGYVNEEMMLMSCMAGVLIGDGLMFMLGASLGKKVKRFRWIKRVLTENRLLVVQKKFTQYGNFILFFARFLPGLRATIFVFAGLSHRVSFWRFLLIDGFAALISVPIWVYLGIYGAKNIDQLMRWVNRYQIGLYIFIAVTSLIGIAIWWRRHKKQQLPPL